MGNRHWHTSVPVTGPVAAVDPAARVDELGRENRELRLANAILKAAPIAYTSSASLRRSLSAHPHSPSTFHASDVVKNIVLVNPNRGEVVEEPVALDG